MEDLGKLRGAARHDVTPDAGAADRRIGGLMCELFVRNRIGEDHEEIEVAIRSGSALGAAAEEINCLRVEASDELVDERAERGILGGVGSDVGSGTSQRCAIQLHGRSLPPRRRGWPGLLDEQAAELNIGRKAPMDGSLEQVGRSTVGLDPVRSAEGRPPPEVMLGLLAGALQRPAPEPRASRTRRSHRSRSPLACSSVELSNRRRASMGRQYVVAVQSLGSAAPCSGSRSLHTTTVLSSEVVTMLHRLHGGVD